MVYMESNDHMYAVRRPKLADGTMFVMGRFYTVLATPELRLAVDRGHLKHVFKWQAYRRAPVFENTYRIIHELRAERPRDPLIKILAQAIHGGTAKRRDMYQGGYLKENDTSIPEEAVSYTHLTLPTILLV